MSNTSRKAAVAGRSYTAIRGLDSPTSNKTQRTRKIGAAPNLPPSPAKSVIASPHRMDMSELVTREEERLTRDLDRGAPGDAAIFSADKTPEQREISKKKSQFYGDAFAYRESNSSARERVLRESIVMAEIRTNVIINDEYTFITDLSYNLSNRYQRPEPCILVTVAHSACLLFGGSFDPAYIMTITALPSQVQPVTNKRNAMLLQRQLEESLGVSPSRGIIKFVGIAEENFAFNGKTFAGEIEELEREQAEDNANLARSLSRGALKVSKKRHSMRSLKNLKIGSGGAGKDLMPMPSPTKAETTPPLSDNDTLTPTLNMIPIPAIPVKSDMDKRAEKAQKVGRRKSFIQGLFSRGLAA